MNPTRKAELQRKLSMTPLPHPPPGLADRIKAAIPDTISPEMTTIGVTVRERRTRTVASTLRMAASMLLLLSSLWVCLRVARVEDAHRQREHEVAGAIAPIVPHPARTGIVPSPSDSASASSSVVGKLAEARSEPAPRPRIVVDPTGDHPAAFDSRAADATIVDSVATDNVAEPDAGASRSDVLTARKTEAPAAPASQDAEARRAERSLAALPHEVTQALEDQPVAQMAAGVPAPPPPPPSTVAAPMPLTVSAGRAAVAPEASRSIPAGNTITSDSLLGVTLKPDAYVVVRDALQRGERPRPDSVDVASLVNHFAEERPARHDRNVRLEADASRSPFEAKNQLLRLSVDTPRSSGFQLSRAIASDARLTVDFDPLTTRRHRMIGTTTTADKTVGRQSSLAGGVSLTSLYEIEISPSASRSQRVATVRLQYRSAEDGKLHSIEKTILRSDVVPEWTSASVRLRIAALAGAFGELLRGHGDYAKRDLARLTHELAIQNPGAAQANELSTLVDANAQLQ